MSVTVSQDDLPEVLCFVLGVLWDGSIFNARNPLWLPTKYAREEVLFRLKHKTFNSDRFASGLLGHPDLNVDPRGVVVFFPEHELVVFPDTDTAIAAMMTRGSYATTGH